MEGEKAPRPRDTVESDGGGGGDDGGVDAADRAGSPSPVESSPPAAAGSEKATVADVNAESPLLGFVALAAAMRGALPPIDGEADEPPVLLAPDGVDMGALAEAYGAALGQALVTSGLGLDVQAVVSGMLSAAACDDSPMSVEMCVWGAGCLPEWFMREERSEVLTIVFRSVWTRMTVVVCNVYCRCYSRLSAGKGDAGSVVASRGC